MSLWVAISCSIIGGRHNEVSKELAVILFRDKVKGKATLRACSGPKGCFRSRSLKLPDFKTIGI
jgi:hypothetical protein